MSTASNDGFQRVDFDREQVQEETGGKGGIGFFGGCLIGCGILSLLSVIALAVGSYFAYSYVNKMVVQDPAKLVALRQEIAPSTVPPKYESKFGINMEWPVKFKGVVIHPEGIDPANDKNKRGKVTFMFLVDLSEFDEANADQIKVNGILPAEMFDRNAADDEFADKEIVEMKDTKVWIIRKEEGPNVQYFVEVKPGVIFGALGPKSDFDKEAMLEFLKSMDGEQAPKKVTPEELEAYQKNQLEKAQAVIDNAKKKVDAAGKTNNQPQTKTNPETKTAPQTKTNPEVKSKTNPEAKTGKDSKPASDAKVEEKAK